MDDVSLQDREDQPKCSASETCNGASVQLANAPPTRGIALRFHRKRWILASFSALLLAGVAVGLMRLGENSPVGNHSGLNILPVMTTQLKLIKSYVTTQTFTGEVVAQRATELGFERAGELVWLNVDRGNLVKAGTPIAKIDTRNLEAQRLQLVAQKAGAVAVLEELQNGPRKESIAAARAQVKDLETQLQLEQIKRTRRENLWQEGAISREQFDEVAYGSNALLQRLAVVRSELEELLTGTRQEQIAAQQAAVKQLEANISELEISIAKSTIEAPFSGIIAARRLDEGTVVNPGQSIVRLVEDVSPEVEIGVSVQVAAGLRVGSRHQVQIGQKSYDATIASILPEVNPATRTRTVVLNLPSTSQAVTPQQIARLKIRQNVPTNGYWLPTTALVQGERGLWSCYTLVEVERQTGATQEQLYQVERRDVEVLHAEGERVLVRGTIQAGNTVIVDGTQRVVPGQLVRPALS